MVPEVLKAEAIMHAGWNMATHAQLPLEKMALPFGKLQMRLALHLLQKKEGRWCSTRTWQRSKRNLQRTLWMSPPIQSKVPRLLQAPMTRVLWRLWLKPLMPKPLLCRPTSTSSWGATTPSRMRRRFGSWQMWQMKGWSWYIGPSSNLRRGRKSCTKIWKSWKNGPSKYLTWLVTLWGPRCFLVLLHLCRRSWPKLEHKLPCMRNSKSTSTALLCCGKGGFWTCY